MADLQLPPSIKAAAEEILAQYRVPSSLYRLQLNSAFTFSDAEKLVPYLYDLGVGDFYASPLLKARPESNHGYDICDHSQLNPVLGGAEAFLRFSQALRERGMGLVLDTVPNHMAIFDSNNQWWQDVLENGPSSVYASFFDIYWHPVTPELENKVLTPILEDQYGKVLESGKLRLIYEDGGFYFHHHETRLPVTLDAYSSILGRQLDSLAAAFGENGEHEHLQEFQSILTALAYLPPYTEIDVDKMAERHREKEVIKRRLAALVAASPEVQAAVCQAVSAFNGVNGGGVDSDLLDSLLSAQPYRLAFWRVASEEINYRRFFDINHLAAIRTELPAVFDATHHLTLCMLAEGKATGLRIDHPDGLLIPSAYFLHLQSSYVCARLHASLAPEVLPENLEALVSEWLGSREKTNGQTCLNWPLYVVAEKILAQDETLPGDWAVFGTTGYEFLNAVNGLFVDRRARTALDTVYSNFTGMTVGFPDLLDTAKKTIMHFALVSELSTLSYQLERIAKKNRRYRDFTLNSLTFAIREIISCLSVYRTYISGPAAPVAQRDQYYVEAAVSAAKRRNPGTAETIFDFVRDVLLLRNIEEFAEEERNSLVAFVLKFQQLTGPVMAKALEDTVFYVYNRLISLNEVGGDPTVFGISVDNFHYRNVVRQSCQPHSLLNTATHDTKRGEDVRARVNVLSEIVDEWGAALKRWRSLNAYKKSLVDGEPAPDPNDEYLLYQTLIGAWPDDALNAEKLLEFRDRIVAYMIKATREAKMRTSWIKPNEEYEEATRSFVHRLLVGRSDDPFLNDFRSLQRRVAYYGQFNSLAQLLLKLTCPGVPDIYQGTELWDLSLVDPDNRRPVDFEFRRSLLRQMIDLVTRAERHQEGLLHLAKRLLAESSDGRVKLYVIYRALNFRRANIDLFSFGAYLPLEANGPRRDHVCAFARTLWDETSLVIVPRLVVKLAAGAEEPPTGSAIWKDTRLVLPNDRVGFKYRNVLTGETLEVDRRKKACGLQLADALAHFPVALLERIQPGNHTGSRAMKSQGGSDKESERR